MGVEIKLDAGGLGTGRRFSVDVLKFFLVETSFQKPALGFSFWGRRLAPSEGR